MLFRKNMDPRCAYCDKGNQINDEEVICKKRGIVPMDGCCRAFRYDPLKREPTMSKPDAAFTSIIEADLRIEEEADEN